MKPLHRFGIDLLWLLTLIMLLAACGRAEPTATPTAATTPTSLPTRQPPTPTPTPEPGILALRTAPVDLANKLPLLAAHLQAVEAALQSEPPILPLRESLAEDQRMAQTIALADARFLANVREPQSGAPLRNEIFGVYPVREGDITDEIASCRQSACYRVEMYNYALNLSTIAFVDLPSEQVIAVYIVPETQPDIPPRLMQIVLEIATQSPEVAAAWGEKPGPADATMANVKTALNQSRCERSRHLCVAPTFVKGEWALWVIVDLTEGALVGLRWTNTGRSSPAVTEKTLQNDVVMARFCDQSTTLERNGWQLDYVLTSSDGLRISNVRFDQQAIIDSIKLVDWHVSYSRAEGFGYSDAIGCPVFSQASVVAFGGPHVEELHQDDVVAGFAIIQEYKSEVWPAPCNYFYSQRFEFYTDGRFRVVFANHGRGCGNDGVYRPVVRIALAGQHTVAAWDGAAWVDWTTEQWQPPSEHRTPEGYQFRALASDGQGFYIEPARGQFDDGGRGDNPYVYVTRRHTEAGANDEGETDLITIGPCCNEDYRQGPEKFIEPAPEPISDSPLVFWYVAQLKNDDRPGQEYCWAEAVLENGVYVPKAYPCYGGPLFVPTP
jgi:hypothetical protein